MRFREQYRLKEPFKLKNVAILLLCGAIVSVISKEITSVLWYAPMIIFTIFVYFYWMATKHNTHEV